MELVRFKKDGRHRIIDIVAKNEPEGALNYDRQINVYSFDKLQAFNFQVVTQEAINNCFEESIEIMGPNLPYVVMEDIQVDIIPQTKCLISITHKE